MKFFPCVFRSTIGLPIIFCFSHVFRSTDSLQRLYCISCVLRWSDFFFSHVFRSTYNFLRLICFSCVFRSSNGLLCMEIYDTESIEINLNDWLIENRYGKPAAELPLSFIKKPNRHSRSNSSDSLRIIPG